MKKLENKLLELGAFIEEELYFLLPICKSFGVNTKTGNKIKKSLKKFRKEISRQEKKWMIW